MFKKFTHACVTLVHKYLPDPFLFAIILTLVGVGVNFYSAGFPRTFIQSFTEGSTLGMRDVNMNSFFDTASRMMARRHVELTPIDKEIFIHIHEDVTEK